MGITFSKVEWSNAVKSFPGKLELQAPVREFLDCTIEPQNQTTEYAIFAKGAGIRGRLKAKGTNKRGWLKFDRADITDT